MRERKYDYAVIQSNFGFGHGWEDECIELTREDWRENIRAYRENSPYPVRTIRRRILREGVTR